MRNNSMKKGVKKTIAACMIAAAMMSFGASVMAEDLMVPVTAEEIGFEEEICTYGKEVKEGIRLCDIHDEELLESISLMKTVIQEIRGER